MREKIRAVLFAAIAAAVLSSCAAENTGDSGVTAAPESVTTAAATAEAVTTTTEQTEQIVTEDETVIEPDTTYVIADGITPRMKQLSYLNIGNRARLREQLGKLDSGGITVAYLGGSITQGSSATPETCYARQTANWFAEHSAVKAVNYVNAGIGATGSYIGVGRLQNQVLSKNPDIVFVEFSVNDDASNTERNKETYEGIIRQALAAPSRPAVVVICMTQEDGTSFQDYHAEIAKHYDLPVISYKNAILYAIDKGYIKWTDISDDNIHPNVTGHAILTEIVTATLDRALTDPADPGETVSNDLPAPLTANHYNETKWLSYAENKDLIKGGSFTDSAENFGNFPGVWQVKSNDAGVYEDFTPLSFEVDAKTIAIEYGKLTRGGAVFDVIIDGAVAKTIDTDFKGGWGNYVEIEEVLKSDTTEHHVVEIIPRDGDKKTMLNFSGAVIGF